MVVVLLIIGTFMDLAAIGGISVTDALKTIWPFYLTALGLTALGVLLIVVYVPALSLWLPALLR